jgi:hypothetical protein
MLWLPGAQESWTTTLAAFAPFFDPLLTLAPSLAVWAAPVIWLLWALGGITLLVLGVVATLMIRTVKRRLSPSPRQAPSPTTAQAAAH